MRKLFYFPIIISATVACLVLSGCASLQLLSFGASSISYAVSGKSISDHAISTVMEQDCALHRVVMEENVCSEPDGNGILRSARPGANQQVASVSNEAHWQVVAKKTKVPVEPNPIKRKYVSAISPDETVRQLMAANNNNGEVEIGVARPFESNVGVVVKSSGKGPVNKKPVDKGPLLFAVLGSFNELKYARDNLREHPDLNAQIITNPAAAIANGATRYRVVAGPMSEQDFNHNLGRNGDKQAYHAWRLRLCGDSLLPPPCTAPMLRQHAK
ncbi:MAG: hypothetical protein HRT35_29070 [Algicola sp.]|nr:hypothetical protein [Algicola sp.]